MEGNVLGNGYAKYRKDSLAMNSYPNRIEVLGV